MYVWPYIHTAHMLILLQTHPKMSIQKGWTINLSTFIKWMRILSVGSVFWLHKHSVILKYLLLMTLFLLPFCVNLPVYVRFIKLFIDKILTVHNFKFVGPEHVISLTLLVYWISELYFWGCWCIFNIHTYIWMYVMPDIVIWIERIIKPEE